MTRPFYAGDAVTIWRGNALALPIPDGSVDLIVTSPPYFGLRSYTDDGQHYAGQLGDEATPGKFIDALIAATREMVRVLKPTGSIWINLGDKYAGSQPSASRWDTATLQGGRGRLQELAASQSTVPDVEWGRAPAKSLMGIPWRYALRCIDDLGLILRAEQIWSKPNGLPESVTDRTRRSHEQWFHFTKEPRYFSAIDEIREEHLTPDGMGWAANGKGKKITSDNGAGHNVVSKRGGGLHAMGGNPLGKLPGSVWEIPTQPLIVPWGYGVENGCVARHFTDEQDVLGWLRLGTRAMRRRIRPLPDHFAAFPMEWPRRIIRGWPPPGICVECGEGRRPVVDRPSPVGRVNTSIRDDEATGAKTFGVTSQMRLSGGPRQRWKNANPDTLTGYACGCDVPTAPTRPAVVLDPFGGTGTTALVAKSLGRIGWHVDLSADYCRLARWRVTDPGELARALEVRKPPPVPAGADALFDLEGA